MAQARFRFLMAAAFGAASLRPASLSFRPRPAQVPRAGTSGDAIVARARP